MKYYLITCLLWVLPAVSSAQEPILGTTLQEHIEQLRSDFEDLMNNADDKATPMYLNTVTLEINTIRKATADGKVKIFVLEAGLEYEEAYISKMTIPISFTPDAATPIKIDYKNLEVPAGLVAATNPSTAIQAWGDVQAAMAENGMSMVAADVIDWTTGAWMATESDISTSNTFIEKMPNMAKAIDRIPSKSWVCNPNFSTDLSSDNIAAYMTEAAGWNKVFVIPESSSLAWPSILETTGQQFIKFEPLEIMK